LILKRVTYWTDTLFSIWYRPSESFYWDSCHLC